ncbi:hypothetical protein DL93DRAFT_1230359 [Clavulina sp. PMI_390]|nr:hypothetical protein DL93DRAFT_1230359 [Clavulina sp. PMI_390]
MGFYHCTVAACVAAHGYKEQGGRIWRDPYNKRAVFIHYSRNIQRRQRSGRLALSPKSLSASTLTRIINSQNPTNMEKYELVIEYVRQGYVGQSVPFRNGQYTNWILIDQGTSRSVMTLNIRFGDGSEHEIPFANLIQVTYECVSACTPH